MKKVVLLSVLLSLLTTFGFGISYRIALSDFAVHSDNPKYKYMGKGISEMIAVELAKSTDVDLIEREKRAVVLEEIEFALSDLADATRQVEVGKMLAARYLVFGEIVDMDAEVLISLRMVDIESTKVVWNEQIVARISNYDYITGYFTQSILQHLGLSVERTTVAKVQSIEAKNEEAVVAFSKAVDYYDRKENTEAKEELVRARRIDPDSEAVQLYLSKLIVNLSKFKIEAAEMQMPSQNPAYLGIQQYAQVFALYSMDDPAHIFPGGATEYAYLDSIDLEYRGQYAQLYLGISFPLGERFGIQTSLFHWHKTEGLRTGIYGTEYGAGPYDWGAQVNLGWAAADWLSVGIGTSVFLEEFGDSELPGIPTESGTTEWRSAHCLGVLVKNRGSTVLFDLLTGYSFGRRGLLNVQGFKDYLAVPTPFAMQETTAQPILLEGTLTFTLRERSVFLVLRQTNEIFVDQDAYSGWLNPGAEFWVSSRFAVRSALDLALHKTEEVVEYGIGFTGGITLRSSRRGWDLDLGGSYQLEPIRSIPGEVEYEPVVYINLSKNLLSIAR
jgi:TolB-like protein